MNDIELENNDLKIIAGDFNFTESLQQDAYSILVSATGHWTNDPPIGADIENLINDDISIYGFKSSLKRHLRRDGIVLKKFDFTDKLELEVTR